MKEPSLSVPASFIPRRSLPLIALAILCTALQGGSADPASYRYNIILVSNTAPGDFPVVTFEVTDPSRGNWRYDIHSDLPFNQGALSRLAVIIGWDTRDYNNTGSGSSSGAAYPISINALTASMVNPDLTFTVVSPTPVPDDARGTGTVGIEGHPAGDADGDGVFETAVPVRSAFRHFPITDPPDQLVPRRQVVDIGKCNRCHGSLSLHGNNRTDEIQVCVVCHNPNQTDITYRTSGAEESVDFKRMIHGIHAGGMRRNPLIIIGFRGSVNDFSGVRFPAKLSNCLNCHADRTFELPLGGNVLASTIQTGSSLIPKVIDVDPANDLNITPTAAVCSACHDGREARRHMVERGGARFAVTQGDIDAGLVRERCVRCHGPGEDKDVRRVHEIRNPEGGDDEHDDHEEEEEHERGDH